MRQGGDCIHSHTYHNDIDVLQAHSRRGVGVGGGVGGVHHETCISSTMQLPNVLKVNVVPWYLESFLTNAANLQDLTASLFVAYA